MIKEYYKIYMRDTIRLSKLMLIKFNDTIELINEKLILQYGKGAVLLEYPTTWKYYLNVSGQYHSTDTVMKVFSLDTSEEIIFNKENLDLHVETRKAYQNLSVHYYNLVDKYPEQELLIRGILFPVDIQEAIDAEEDSILTYPSDLIEPQEVTLIQELSEWLKHYLVRWHVKAFMTTDSYYPASYQAVLFLTLPGRLLNLRLKRARTNEAHSFHIRAYLASHGRLDRFYDYLTLEQRLFLYRNLLYIEKHSGIKEDFYWLVERILTRRKIPIGEFSARQYKGFDQDYYSNYHYRKSPINTPFNIPEKDYFTLDEIRIKELDSAPSNRDYWQQNFNKIEKKFQNSGNAIMLTKDLESRMFDYTDSVPHPLPDIILNEWMVRSYQQTYKVLVSFKHPVQSTIYTVTSDVALMYMFYLQLKNRGITLETLPILHAESVLKHPKPSLEEIGSVAYLYHKDRSQLALALYNSIPSVTQYYSKYQFSEYTKKFYKARLGHWFLISNTHELSERAYVEGMVNTLFYDTVLDFNQVLNPDLLSITEWLNSHNLPTNDFTSKETEELIYQIFTNSTGYQVDKSQVLRYIQKAMISIMKQLTSYSVQYLYDINDVDIKPINWAGTRPGNFKVHSAMKQFVDQHTDVIDMHGLQKCKTEMNLMIQPDTMVVHNVPEFIIEDDIGLSIQVSQKDSQVIPVTMKTFDIQISFGDGTVPESWMLQDLSTEQITSLMT